MTVSPDIAAAQAAYAARPFAASITTEGFSGTFRFDTLEQAHAYLRQQINSHGFLQHGVTNNWSNKGVRTHILDTCITLADGTKQDLEEAGIAAQTEGPAGRWVLLEEGEVLDRRLDVGYGEMAVAMDQIRVDLLTKFDRRIKDIEGRNVPANTFVLAWQDGRFIGFPDGNLQNPQVVGFERAQLFGDKHTALAWLRKGLTDQTGQAPEVMFARSGRALAIQEIEKAIAVVEEVR